MMVGRDVVLRVERPPREPGDPVLEVDGLQLVDDLGRARLENLTFSVGRARSSGSPVWTATVRPSWSRS
jgi:ABC-type uncharacterized transport system ATPase subunit